MQTQFRRWLASSFGLSRDHCTSRLATRRRLGESLRLEPLEQRQMLSLSLSLFDPTGEVPETKTQLVAVDGLEDADLDSVIDYDVTSDNANITATLLTGGESIVLGVEGDDDGTGNPFSGEITIMLLEDSAPTAVQRMKDLLAGGQLVGSDFFRIADLTDNGSDIAQGGPQNTGLPDFNDEYDPRYTFTSGGLLAMANAGDDTNNGQFFFVEHGLDLDQMPEHLNFQHPIWGVVTGGNDILEGIFNTPLQGDGTTPVDNPVITSAEIIDNHQDAVVLVSAADGAAGESATITITADSDESAPVELQFSVDAVADTRNDAPYLEPFDTTLETNEDTPLTITLDGVDIDGDALEFRVADPATGQDPANVTVGIEQSDGEATITFTPDADFNGQIDLIVGLFDNVNNPDTQLFTLTVNAVNDQPTAQDIDAGNVDEGGSTPIQLVGDDGDPDVDQTLTYEIVTQPAEGVVKNFDPSTGTLDYAAPVDFTGPVTFTYRVVDDGGTANGGEDTSAVATVTVTVDSINNEPIAEDVGPLAATGGQTLAVQLVGDDGDPEVEQTLTYAIVDQPTIGTIENFDPATGSLDYLAPADFNGTATFTYRVTDDGGTADGGDDTSELATVTINVDDNDIPDIGGTLFNDENGNGQVDDGENPYGGVVVELYRDDGDGVFEADADALIQTEVTDANGQFRFEDFLQTENDTAIYFISADVPEPQGDLGAAPALTAIPPSVHTVEVVEGEVVSGDGELFAFNFIAEIDGADFGGVKYTDLTGDGLTGDDTPREGVTFELYLDDGDDVFDPNVDALVATDVTDANGQYTFEDRIDGRYFIREAQPSDALQTHPVSPDYYTLDVSGGQVYSGDATVIDEFGTSQQTWGISIFDPDPTHLEAGGSSDTLIGGERDLLVDIVGTPIDPMTTSGTVGEDGGDSWLTFNSVTPGASVTLQYDGADADTAGPPAALINSEGLDEDLTANDGAAFRFDFERLQVGGGQTSISVSIDLTDSFGDTASFDGLISEGTDFLYFAPFSSFEDAQGDLPGVDFDFSFADVTSIEIVLNGSGVDQVDYTLDNIVIAASRTDGFDFANKLGSLAGTVYVDINDNAQIDPGEWFLANVEVQLYEDANGDGSFDPSELVATTTTDVNGNYSFTNLPAGSYAIVEIQPAAFHDGQDTVGTEGGLVGNDIFSEISLGAGVDGEEYLFGESFLKIEYASKRSLLRPELDTNTADGQTGQPVEVPVDQQEVGEDGRQDEQQTGQDDPAGDMQQQTEQTDDPPALMGDPGVDPIDDATVWGTDGDDLFEVFLGDSPADTVVRLNGNRIGDITDPSQLHLVGGPGEDRLIVHGSSGDEIALLGPDSAEIVGSGIELTAAGMERQEVFSGGGNDSATLIGTEGNDALVLSPDEARMTSDRTERTLTGFSRVKATGGGGQDVARFIDSAGDDTFVVRPAEAEMIGDGFHLIAAGFDVYQADALAGGNDSATLYDTPGDDTLLTDHRQTTLQGDAYLARVTYFERVDIEGEAGGSDNATLTDTEGNDLFVAAPGNARSQAEGLVRYIRGFEDIEANASQGTDVARLIDSPGDDLFVAKETGVELSGEGFRVAANGFDQYQAESRNGGYDRAWLNDSAGNDHLTAVGDWAKMTYPEAVAYAMGFDHVTASSSEGGDDTKEIDAVDLLFTLIGDEAFSEV